MPDDLKRFRAPPDFSALVAFAETFAAALAVYVATVVLFSL